MELNETQKKQIAEWADEGCSLAEIQKRINEEFNLSLTFMDVRLILLDNNIKLKDRDKKPSQDVDITKMPASEEAAPGEDHAPPGKVTVEIDKLKKPGALINGSVTFSDGVSASWFLDQSGRLGLSPSQPGYHPTESDLQEFQQELSSLIQSRGF